MGHRRNMCQPRAPALALERNPKLGFHRRAQGGNKVGEAPASGRAVLCLSMDLEDSGRSPTQPL